MAALPIVERTWYIKMKELDINILFHLRRLGKADLMLHTGNVPKQMIVRMASNKCCIMVQVVLYVGGWYAKPGVLSMEGVG